MQQLILLLGGTIILAALSQNYYPYRIFRRDDKHFLKQQTDVFLLAIIIWIAFFVMKQAMAVSILMLAIPFLIKKKYISYYLLVFLAVGFHTHAIVYLALPLLFGKPWGIKTKLLVVAVGVVILNYNSTLGAVLRYAESL